jgi:uncharacterized protein (TIGR03000 family)
LALSFPLQEVFAMYSVVLMMALAGGAEAPDHHNRGGCSGSYACSGYGGGYGCSGYGGYGCSGYVGSYGCSGYSGGHGCTGGRHKLFGGHRHGCSGGYACSGYGGGYGCSGYGGGYACSGYGGGYGCTGVYGGGYGCTGVYGGGYGCSGGVPYMPQVPPMGGKPMPEPIKPPVKPDVKPDQVAAPATVVVNLPADAKLTVDGRATSSVTAVRTFVSPTLLPNHSYTYTLTAEVMQNGTPVRQSQQIAVRAGQETRVEFNFATSTVGTDR